MAKQVYYHDGLAYSPYFMSQQLPLQTSNRNQHAAPMLPRWSSTRTHFSYPRDLGSTNFINQRPNISTTLQIPSYRGISGEKSPSQFLFELDQYEEVVGIDESQLLLRVLPLALQKEAQEWYIAEQYNLPFWSYADFKSRFLTAFQPHHESFIRIQELSRRIQSENEPLPLFLQLMAELCDSAGIIDGTFFMSSVYNQMHPKYKPYLVPPIPGMSLAHFKVEVDYAEIKFQRASQHNLPSMQNNIVSTSAPKFSQLRNKNLHQSKPNPCSLENKPPAYSPNLAAPFDFRFQPQHKPMQKIQRTMSKVTQKSQPSTPSEIPAITAKSQALPQTLYLANKYLSVVNKILSKEPDLPSIQSHLQRENNIGTSIIHDSKKTQGDESSSIECASSGANCPEIGSVSQNLEPLFISCGKDDEEMQRNQKSVQDHLNC